MFQVSYTWSKSMDDSSNYRDIVPDTYNTTNLWGRSEYDARHIVVINYLYALPFFQNQNTLTSSSVAGSLAAVRSSRQDSLVVSEPTTTLPRKVPRKLLEALRSAIHNPELRWCWREFGRQLWLRHQYLRGSDSARTRGQPPRLSEGSSYWKHLQSCPSTGPLKSVQLIQWRPKIDLEREWPWNTLSAMAAEILFAWRRTPIYERSKGAS
jgi:hypothetical protein